MAIAKLNKKENKPRVASTEEHKIALLNTLYFLDEIVVSVVLNRVIEEEHKISPKDYSKILVSSSTVSGINEQNKDEIVKMIEARAEEVRKGVRNFIMDYTLSLKNKNSNDNIGIFKVKKSITFIDDDKVVISYDLSDSNNNEIYKIIFDELRNEYKKLEIFDLERLYKYVAEGVSGMYNRVAAANPNKVN